MTNVSKRKIQSAEYKQVYSELIHLISSLDKAGAITLTQQLLTEAEQVMLTKRFGAILMFSLDYTPYRISQTLDISLPTISKLYEQFQGGEFEDILKNVTRPTRNKFLTLINDLILAQASPRARARLMNRALN